MRIAVDPKSPFYQPLAPTRVLVTVDGVPVDGAIEADEEGGWADCVLFDKAGKAILANNGDGLIIARVFGRVKIFINNPGVNDAYQENGKENGEEGG